MPVLRRVLATLLLGGLAALGTLVAAPAAVAHDQLVSTSPAGGEVLTTAPTALTLQFSDDVLDLSQAVVLTLPDGSTRDDLAVTVTGPTVTATLPADLVSGAYGVAWRVVSSDGHPIEGTFAYTVDDPTRPAAGSTPSPAEPPAESPATATPEVTAEATTEPTTEPSPTATPLVATEEPDAGSTPAWPWLVAGALLATGAVAATVLVRRRRGSQEP